MGSAGSVKVGGTKIEDKKVTVGGTIIDSSSVTTTVKADTYNTGDSEVFFNSTGLQAGTVRVTKAGFVVGPTGPSMTSSGIDAGGMKITSVAPGRIAPDSTDAINGSQLYQTNQRIDSHDSALRKLAHRDAQLERKIYRAGVGQYHDSSAVSVGAFYRPTENVMISVGASLNDSDSMVNAGLSYRFGTGSGNKTSPNNIHELRRRVSDLSQDNQSLSAQLSSTSQRLASADKEIASLKDEIAQIKKMLKGLKKK